MRKLISGREVSATGLIYAVVEINSLKVKYVSTIRAVLEEIVKNEMNHPHVGRLEIVSRVVAFEVPDYRGTK